MSSASSSASLVRFGVRVCSISTRPLSPPPVRLADTASVRLRSLQPPLSSASCQLLVRVFSRRPLLPGPLQLRLLRPLLPCPRLLSASHCYSSASASLRSPLLGPLLLKFVRASASCLQLVRAVRLLPAWRTLQAAPHRPLQHQLRTVRYNISVRAVRLLSAWRTPSRQPRPPRPLPACFVDTSAVRSNTFLSVRVRLLNLLLSALSAQRTSPQQPRLLHQPSVSGGPLLPLASAGFLPFTKPFLLSKHARLEYFTKHSQNCRRLKILSFVRK